MAEYYCKENKLCPPGNEFRMRLFVESAKLKPILILLVFVCDSLKLSIIPFRDILLIFPQKKHQMGSQTLEGGK